MLVGIIQALLLDFPTTRTAWIKGRLGTADERGMALHLCAKAQILLQGLRYANILPHLEIEGPLSVEEAIRLYDLAQGLGSHDAVVVESGCAAGKASLVLAKALQAQTASTLYCIHPQCSSPPHSFLENLRSGGGLSAIKNLSGSPRELAAGLRRSIDLLVLGPEADYATLLTSFRAWAPLLKAGAHIVLRGVDSVLKGPRQVVASELCDPEQWAEGELVGSMYCTDKLGRSSLAIGAS